MILTLAVGCEVDRCTDISGHEKEIENSKQTLVQQCVSAALLSRALNGFLRIRLSRKGFRVDEFASDSVDLGREAESELEHSVSGGNGGGKGTSSSISGGSQPPLGNIVDQERQAASVIWSGGWHVVRWVVRQDQGDSTVVHLYMPARSTLQPRFLSISSP